MQGWCYKETCNFKKVKSDGLFLIKIKKQEGQRIYLVHDSSLSICLMIASVKEVLKVAEQRRESYICPIIEQCSQYVDWDTKRERK